MRKYIFLMCSLCFLFTFCKTDQTPKELNPEQIAPAQTSDQKERSIRQGNSKWTFLTAHRWKVDALLIMSDSTAMDRYKGQFLSFFDDETYIRYSQSDEKIGWGKFTFNPDEKLLLMEADGGDAEKTSEWKIKSVGDVLILQGTRKFGNNNTHAKLLREFRAIELGK